MTTIKPTPEELETGYSECDCGKSIHLHQAGYEVDLRHCVLCGKWVANTEEFFKFQTGSEILSK